MWVGIKIGRISKFSTPSPTPALALTP